MNSDREASLRQSAIEVRAPVNPSPDCVRTATATATANMVGLCSLTGKSPGTTPDELKEQVVVQQEASVTLQWLTALSDYATALSAITDATDRAALVDAEGKLAVSVKALAKQHDEALKAKAKAGDARAKSTPPIGDAAAASVGLIASAANAILDRQRLQALKVAVNQADGPVQLLAGYIGEEQKILQDIRRASLTQYATELTVGLGPASPTDAYTKSLDKAISATQQVNTLDGARPEEAADKMASAHTKVRDAINSGKGQDLLAIQSITEFLAAAQAVHEGFTRTTGEIIAGSREVTLADMRWNPWQM